MSKTVPLLGKTAEDLVKAAAQIAVHGNFFLKNRQHSILSSIYQIYGFSKGVYREIALCSGIRQNSGSFSRNSGEFRYKMG